VFLHYIYCVVLVAAVCCLGHVIKYDWLIYWLIDWLIDWSIDLLIYLLIVTCDILCSNPAVQVAAIEAGALHQLIRQLSVETSVTLRSRLLAAMSSLIRQFPFAQLKFMELGGLHTLSTLLTHRSRDSGKLSIKAVTLVSDLLIERVRNFAQLLSAVLVTVKH